MTCLLLLVSFASRSTDRHPPRLRFGMLGAELGRDGLPRPLVSLQRPNLILRCRLPSKITPQRVQTHLARALSQTRPPGSVDPASGREATLNATAPTALAGELLSRPSHCWLPLPLLPVAPGCPESRLGLAPTPTAKIATMTLKAARGGTCLPRLSLSLLFHQRLLLLSRGPIHWDSIYRDSVREQMIARTIFRATVTETTTTEILQG